MIVFVYGTLTDPTHVGSVIDTFDFVGDAVLSGLHRVDGQYPTLAPGGETEGRLLETPDMAMLDAYEGVGRGLYVRVVVPMGETEVAVYVGDPTRLGVKKPVSWPGDGTFEQRVRRYVHEEAVCANPAE
ncbi:gamma-glutamylcyclotransferase [Haladaptatus pallidirubidus]|uniref:Gamma-glutamylcyclotransferase AIG2-like domain-containing protein n=1 Tax=Haladaptatus pallidirubidus TaxID=1008152 RepID=A0AAV3UGY0_9EURY|nr:gamma-glutamylcyclotransferase family protein [Haladaptatus pallidirubidus]